MNARKLFLFWRNHKINFFFKNVHIILVYLLKFCGGMIMKIYTNKMSYSFCLWMLASTCMLFSVIIFYFSLLQNCHSHIPPQVFSRRSVLCVSWKGKTQTVCWVRARRALNGTYDTRSSDNCFMSISHLSNSWLQTLDPTLYLTLTYSWT